MNICLILSAGLSTRFANDMPKQYHLLAGKEVLAYSIDGVCKSKLADKTIISASENFIANISELYRQYSVEIITGGDTRNQSLRNGLECIKARYPQCEKIFINEAARPFITGILVDDYFTKLNEYDAVITTQYITDSLGRIGEHITDRSQYYMIQAPEAFRFDLLYDNFQANSPITATVQQLPPGCRIYRNFDFRHNIKITYPEDLVIAEALMRYIH